MTTEIQCAAKHTAYNPSDEEWRCPKCGAGYRDGDFAIDTSAEGTSEDCTRLHAQDLLYCVKCDYSTTGSRFAGAVAKAKNLVPCPTCKGHGVVDGPKMKGSR